MIKLHLNFFPCVDVYCFIHNDVMLTMMFSGKLAYFVGNVLVKITGVDTL
jgi:hypothetical protein